jgi:hypothetical protein
MDVAFVQNFKDQGEEQFYFLVIIIMFSLLHILTNIFSFFYSLLLFFGQTRENLPNIKGAGKLMDVSEHAEEPGAELSIAGHSSRSKINVDNKV